MRAHTRARLHTCQRPTLRQTLVTLVRRQIQVQIRQTQRTPLARLRTPMLHTLSCTARRVQEERTTRIETSRAILGHRRLGGQVHAPRRSTSTRRGVQGQFGRVGRLQGDQARQRHVLSTLRVHSGRVSTKAGRECTSGA